MTEVSQQKIQKMLAWQAAQRIIQSEPEQLMTICSKTTARQLSGMLRRLGAHELSEEEIQDANPLRKVDTSMNCWFRAAKNSKEPPVYIPDRFEEKESLRILCLPKVQELLKEMQEKGLLEKPEMSEEEWRAVERMGAAKSGREKQ